MELNDRIKAHATQAQRPLNSVDVHEKLTPFTYANGPEWDDPAPHIIHGEPRILIGL